MDLKNKIAIMRGWCLAEAIFLCSRSEHDSRSGFIVRGANWWMNELTDNQILQANPPVVPAGMVSLRCLTTSIRFVSLAVAVRQRIILVVSALGFSKSACSKCRFSFSLRTISFGSHDGNTSDSTTLQGRASDLSSLSKEIERVEIFVTIKIVIEKKNV